MLLLFKKYIYSFKTRFFLALFILSSALAASTQMPSDTFNTKSGTIIMFKKFDKKYYKTLQYLKFADRLISAHLNSSAIKRKYICRIFVLDEKVKEGIDIVGSSEYINIYLNKDFRIAKNKFTIINKMINAMLLGKTGFNPNVCKYPLPQWISIGIYGKLELRFSSHSILPVSYFPGLKALCQSNKLPDFRRSLYTALSPEKDGTAYQLYQEFCRFTMLEIKRLSSRSDNLITDLIFLTARNKYSTDEIFNYTIGRAVIKHYDKMRRHKNKRNIPDQKSDAQKIQEWFKIISNMRLINQNSPLHTQFFVERFKRFRQFTYIHKTKEKALKPITMDISRITEFYDKYGKSVEFNEMLDKKNLELDALLYVCQSTCAEHLERLRNTLQQFERLPTVIIKRRLTKVLVKIKQALEKQQKIEDYLRKIEYTTITPGKLYRYELIEDKRLRKNFCSSINKYLDKVEKSFLRD